MGTIVTTEDVEKEGMSRDGDTNTSGESGGVWTGGEYQETMQLVS